MKSGLTSLVAGLYKVQAGVMTAAGAISDGKKDTSSTTLIGGLNAMSNLTSENQSAAEDADTKLNTVITYLNNHKEKDITTADILSARNGLCTQYQTMLGQLQKWGYYNPDNDSISTPDVSSLGNTLTEKTAAYQKAASAYADAYATYKAAEAMSSNAATASYHAARAKAAPFLLDDEDTESEDESSENAMSSNAATASFHAARAKAAALWDDEDYESEDESSDNADSEAASVGIETYTDGSTGSASTGSTGMGAGDSSDTAGNGTAESSETASTASTVSSETASTASSDMSSDSSTAGSSSSQAQSTEESGLTVQTVSQEESPEITSTDVDALKQASDAAYSAMTKAATAMAEAQTAYTNAMAAKTIIDQKPDSVKANIDEFNAILAKKNVTIPEDQKYSVYPPTTGESSDTTGTTVPSGTDGTAPVTYGNALDSALSAKESVGAIKVNEGILLQSETTEIASLKSLYQTLNAVAGPDGQIEKELNKNKSMLSNASNMIDSLPALSSGIQSAADGASTLSAGAQSLASGAAGADAGAAKLQAGAKELDTGAGTLKSGIDSANSGTGNLYDGAVSLDDGAGKLYSGSASLDDGAGSLYNGAVKLNDGAGTLYDGTVDLDNGAGDLYDGVVKLDDGAQDLYDGAMQLLDGSGDLDDGTQDLLDGIIKLNDEGIKKLTELFGDNVQDAVDRIKAVKNASNDYQTFTEIAPSEDKDAVNTVKFVYRTAAVKAE